MVWRSPLMSGEVLGVMLIAEDGLVDTNSSAVISLITEIFVAEPVDFLSTGNFAISIASFPNQDSNSSSADISAKLVGAGRLLLSSSHSKSSGSSSLGINSSLTVVSGASLTDCSRSKPLLSKSLKACWFCTSSSNSLASEALC